MNIAQEQHCPPEHVTKLWGLSSSTTRRLFEHVPGVLIVDRPEKLHKRRYGSMRIPASIAARVHRQLLHPVEGPPFPRPKDEPGPHKGK